MMLSKTRAISVIIAAIVIATSAWYPAWCGDDPAKAETKMGREAAAEIEKEVKLITDAKIVERIERIGKALAAAANSEKVPASYGSDEVYKFDYKFKVIDDKSVNAFSLPGGLIYVNKGLLDYTESDHELAGVLAHEVAHASHHHMTHLLKEQSKLDGHIALVLIAGMLAKMDSRNLGHILIGAQLVRIARSSGYGQKAEADADASAVVYATKAGFNPVGCLTFMERLAHDYAARPAVDLGIMQTHPSAPDRCKAVTAQIKALGLPINRRAVTKSLSAVVEQVEVNGTSVHRVQLGDKTLFEAAPLADGVSSQQRAEMVATKVNQLLDSEPLVRDITVSADGTSVLARGEPIVMVTRQDSDLQGKPAAEVAHQTAKVLKLAVWGEMVQRLY